MKCFTNLVLLHCILPEGSRHLVGQRPPLHPSIHPVALQFTPQSVTVTYIGLQFKAFSLRFHAAISAAPDNRSFFLSGHWMKPVSLC